ncbi:helix-turn-helix domain-containing protein [Shouchella miscanthi]|uniref:helix-turn-helix domain-containing protein n=1 Tax=Shouchella miscanthi TaxID=2598861 RepID=UPI0011A4549F|nr:helix-turn-helix transcriptional regulator [Shouchella miscanthi]
MSVLSERLKEARLKSGLKQIEASKKLGISNGTLSGYERDYRDPDTNILNKMATLYDVSVDWLIGKTNTESEDDVIEAALKDPKAKVLFANWNDMNDEQKDEALQMIQYVLYKKDKDNRV